jgi:N-methylhydantoinase B/oxoprolinase/acetone carboxylase alpha subunit
LTFPEAFGTVCEGKFSDVYMKRGDVIRLETSGGGGYGDPRQRDLERVLHDVEEGFVSAGQAEGSYKVRVNGQGGAERA